MMRIVRAGNDKPDTTTIGMGITVPGRELIDV
jgi:hypothetical protein